jgi:hypothetical protein
VSVAPMLEEALGLPDEVVKPFVAAVYGLTSAHHGGLDILTGEESCAPPVRRGRFFFGHAQGAPQADGRFIVAASGRPTRTPARSCRLAVTIAWLRPTRLAMRSSAARMASVASC